LKHVSAQPWRAYQQQQQGNVQENTHNREEFSDYLDTLQTEYRPQRSKIQTQPNCIPRKLI
ncbi:MAG: hypothetical protein ACKPJD_10400, partial [Planctomycetaceae bacterium]